MSGICARLRPPPRLRSGSGAAPRWASPTRTISRSPAAPNRRSPRAAPIRPRAMTCWSGWRSRAAARARRLFAHGVLQEIDQTTVRTRTGTHSLLDSVGFVSGVSGGAVTAAYYGLKKRAALADFREKFLIRNAEAGLNTSVDPLSLVKALGGGVNDVKVFSRWLNENLFDGATFADFRKTPGRGSGSTPPTSTTARPSSTARRPSSRCAAIWRPIRSPMRWRPRPRCRSCSRRW